MSGTEVTVGGKIATASDSQPRTNANGQDIFETLSARINDGLADISAILIITAKAKTDTDITISPTTGEVKKDKDIVARLSAMTSIGLDGDIVEVIPDDSVDAQKRGEVMQIHDKNVERGVNNWNNFVDGIVKIVRIAADLSGRSLPSSFNDAGKVVTIPPSP